MIMIKKLLKKAEKDQGTLVIRLFETKGRHSRGTLQGSGTLVECDMTEWSQIGERVDINGVFDLDFSPFQIRTFKLVL